MSQIHDSSDAHIFSLYDAQLSAYRPKIAPGALLTIVDDALIHRMCTVLRLQVGERCILFDQTQHATVVLQQISKKSIVARIEVVEQNKILQPMITFLLPLLKKEALHDAVYALCEAGVSNIQLVVTQKSRSSLFSPKEFDRLQQSIIAAAEQSKNYAFSNILAPQPLHEQFLKSLAIDEQKIVFDSVGTSLKKSTALSQPSSKILLIGPEGGLTQQELQLVQVHGFECYVLTPTILRAVQAAGVVASLFHLQ